MALWTHWGVVDWVEDPPPIGLGWIHNLIPNPWKFQSYLGIPCQRVKANTDCLMWELGTPDSHDWGQEDRQCDVIAWWRDGTDEDYVVYLATPEGLFVKYLTALEHRRVDTGDGYEEVDYIKVVPRHLVDPEYEISYGMFAPKVIAEPCFDSRHYVYAQRGWI